MVKYDPYKKLATVYHLGEHKCHDKLYILKDKGPGTAQSTTSSGTMLAKKKALIDVAQKFLEGDTDGAEKESVMYLEQRTQRLNDTQENPSHTVKHDLNSFDALQSLRGQWINMIIITCTK